MKIRKNDKVKIIAGKDKGKTGKVIKILSQSGRILVEGLNLYKNMSGRKTRRKRRNGFNAPVHSGVKRDDYLFILRPSR